MTPEEQRALAQKLATSPEYQSASPEKKQAMVDSFRRRYVTSTVAAPTSAPKEFMVDPLAGKPDIAHSMAGVMERHGMPDIGRAGELFNQLSTFQSTTPSAPGTMNALLEKRGIPPVTPESGANAMMLGLMFPQGVKVAAKGLGVAGQEMAGAGREPVLQKRIAREATVTERRAAYQARQAERQTAYDQRVRDTLAEHTRSRAEKRSAYEQKYAEKKADFDARQAERQAAYEAKRAETVAKHQEELAAAKRGYGESVSQAERAKIRESVLETKKRSYSELKDRLAREVTDNIVKAEGAERGSLDQRFNDLRQKVGDAEVKVPIGDAIEEGRAKLMGEPNSLKIFNDIVKRFDTGERMDVEGGGTKPVFRETMPFDEARTHYTALGEARSGDIPWNVQRALEHVQDTFDNGIKRTIDMKLGASGVETYSALKGDWADYLRTWRDARPVSKGGSVLAQVVTKTRAPLVKGGMSVAQDVGDLFTGKAGRNASYLLSRKKAFGADPMIVARLRQADARLQSLPKSYGRIPAVKRPEFPKYAAPPQPKGETFEPPTASKSERYTPPAPPTQETLEIPGEVDPVAVRRQRLLERAARPASWWDILFPPAGIEHAALKNNKILEWLAKQPRNELPLPGP